MENCNEKEIFVALKAELTSLCRATEKYINGFDTETVIFFSIDEKEKKRLLTEYDSFTVRVRHAIDKCDDLISSLSRLVIFADQNRNSQKTALLSCVLDSYLSLYNEVSLFVRKCEDEFRKSVSLFRPSNILLNSRRLLTAIKTILSEIPE